MADEGDFRLALDRAADEAGRSTRRYTTAINSAGIGVTLAIGGKIMELSIHPVHTLLWPFALFAVGLLLTGVSTMLAKHKRVSDRDSVYSKREMNNWNRLFYTNWNYEIAAIICFVAGVLVEITILWNLDFSKC